MSLTTVYDIGTATVVAGSTTVTGNSTAWVGAGVREGDYFWVNGLTVRVLSCSSSTSLTLAQPWPGPSLSAVPYEIRYTMDGERSLAAAQNVLSALRSGSLGALTSLEPGPDTIAYYTSYNAAELTPFKAPIRDLAAADDVAAMQAVMDLVAQSGLTDATLNRVLKTGSFGLGSIDHEILPNIDSFTIPAGFHRVDARITTGVLPPSSDIADGLIVLHPTPSQTMQVYLGMTENGRNFIRKSNSDGTWAPWRSIMLDFEFGAGPGSGLDADTVDGYQASDFVLATDFTSAGMLAYLLPVDGAGSQLDADMVDGLHASSLVQTTGNQTVAGNKTFSGANTQSGILTFTAVPRLNVNGAEQLAIGYGRNVIPTLQFYNNTTKRGSIADNNTTGMTITSGAGGALFIGADGVLTINGVQVATTGGTGAIQTQVDANTAAIAAANTSITNLDNTKLNASAYTAADVLDKIKTVDGAGSGLDADLLDGLSSGSFLRKDANTAQAIDGQLTVENSLLVKAESSSTTAVSTVLTDETGVECGRFWWSRTDDAINIRHGTSATQKLSITSTAFTFGGNKVWHAGNDGTGSGLDADMLDGQEGSYYASVAGVAAAYLPLAGGTLTGGLTVNSGGVTVNNGWIKNTSGSLIVANTQPALMLQETDQTSGAQTWRMDSAGGSLRLMTASDDGTANHVVINSFSRTGNMAVATDTPTRASGDARWAQLAHTHAEYVPLAGGAMTGVLTVTLSGNTGTYGENGIKYSRTGPTYFDFDGGQVAVFRQSGVEVARIGTNGALDNAKSLATQEAGDARWLKQAGGTITGALSVDGGANFKAGASVWATTAGGNAVLYLRNSAGSEVGLLWSNTGSAETRLRSYATPAGTYKEIILNGSTGAVTTQGPLTVTGEATVSGAMTAGGNVKGNTAVMDNPGTNVLYWMQQNGNNRAVMYYNNSDATLRMQLYAADATTVNTAIIMDRAGNIYAGGANGQFTNLSADNLSSGTVPSARLDPAIIRANYVSGLTHNVVGSIGLFRVNTAVVPGTNYAASVLDGWTGGSGAYITGTPSGTWKAMGRGVVDGLGDKATLMMRVA